jgi:hypothetical protein
VAIIGVEFLWGTMKYSNIFSVVLGFELKASSLLGRCSIT